MTWKMPCDEVHMGLVLFFVASYAVLVLSEITHTRGTTITKSTQPQSEHSSSHGNSQFKPDYETIQALGRSFSLGYLYDIRSDKIIGKSLWDQSELEKNIHEESAMSTRFVVSLSDTINDRSSLMDLSANTKASLQVLDEDYATHVIAGITYGANAYFRFEKTLSETEDKLEVAAKLGTSVNVIPGFEAEADVKQTEGDKEFTDSIRVEFYGDYDVAPPTSYEAAAKTIQELHKSGVHVTDVPMVIELIPLHTLSSKVDILVKQISQQTTEDISQMLMYFDEAMEDLDELLIYKVSAVFPEYAALINKIKIHFKIKTTEFKETLWVLIPKIRRGETEEEELVSIIKAVDKSAFARQYFKPWLHQQRDELKLFNTISNMIKTKAHSDWSIYEEYTYESMISHSLKAGTAGVYVLSACLMSSIHMDLLDKLQKSTSADPELDLVYPTNDNAWSGIKQVGFQAALFRRISSIRRFAESNADTELRVLTYFRYMCTSNEASIDYIRFASMEYTNIDIGIELSNLRINPAKKELTWDVTHSLTPINDEHEIKVEIMYTDIYTEEKKVVKQKLPSDLEAGVYSVKTRAVVVGGGHGDWTSFGHTLEIKGKPWLGIISFFNEGDWFKIKLPSHSTSTKQLVFSTAWVNNDQIQDSGRLYYNHTYHNVIGQFYYNYTWNIDTCSIDIVSDVCEI